MKKNLCEICDNPASTQIIKKLGIKTRDSNGRPLRPSQWTQLPDRVTYLCHECALGRRASLYKEQQQ